MVSTVPGEENSSLAKENGYVINLDRAEKLEKMTYSSLFSKAGIIVLEDTDESLLGKVDKLEVCDNNLYVLEKGRGLFLFNKQGKFIKMIGRQGKGPGEYIDPDDIFTPCFWCFGTEAEGAEPSVYRSTEVALWFFGRYPCAGL